MARNVLVSDNLMQSVLAIYCVFNYKSNILLLTTSK